MITIHLNGEERTFQGNLNLLELLSEIKCPQQSIAVAVNLEVVPRSEFEKVEIKDSDRVEIIQPVGGG